MRRVLHADKHSLNIEEAISAADLQAHLESMVNMDIRKQIFLVEADGNVVAYSTGRGYPEATGVYCYTHHGFVLPEFNTRYRSGADSPQ